MSEFYSDVRLKIIVGFLRLGTQMDCTLLKERNLRLLTRWWCYVMMPCQDTFLEFMSGFCCISDMRIIKYLFIDYYLSFQKECYSIYSN